MLASRIEGYRKPIAGAVTGVLGLLAVFGVNPSWATPELVGSVSAVLAAVVGVVYQVENRRGGINVNRLAKFAIDGEGLEDVPGEVVDTWNAR